MRACLVEGRAPDRRELRSWLSTDATVQLGFPELLVDPASNSSPAALATLDAHVAALRDLLRLIRASPGRDARRASELRRLRSVHPNQRMLAFSSYATTVHALFRELARDGQVAAATAQGGRIASGTTTREEVLRMFRSPRHLREEVKLLLATDLLSEGLNLPEASIVVHLDLPWTAARLEQRVGRARRPGSSTRIVRSYAFVQPRAIEQLIGKEQLIAAKARAAEYTVGALAHGDAVATDRIASPPRATESIRMILRRWGRGIGMSRQDSRIRVAAVRAQRTGFVALIRVHDGNTLIADAVGSPGGAGAASLSGSGRLSATADPNQIHATLAGACGTCAHVEPRSYLAARRAIARWLLDTKLRGSSGTRSHPAPQVRSLLQRLDAATAESPLHTRANTAFRVSRIREWLSGRITHGLEIQISECLRSVASDAQLIEALEALIAGTDEARTPVEGELVAVLLLQTVGQTSP